MPRPPSTGVVTSPFGMRLHPISGGYLMHNGEDTVGSGNYSPVTGTVIFAGWDSSGAGFGNAVAVKQDGVDAVWWMAHFASIAVSSGQRVAEGQHLGALGKTGAATGPHVHTERRAGGSSRPLSGVATNPRSYYTSPAGGGTTPLPSARRKSMSTVYWNGASGPGVAIWALGGDSPGTTANWIETREQSIANSWAAAHGPSVNLVTNAEFANFRSWYQQPVRTTGGAGSGGAGLTPAQDSHLMSIATGEQAGRALTSAVAQVNGHADANRDQIIDAIPGGSGWSSYKLSIDIDNIPGTATGTATAT